MDMDLADMRIPNPEEVEGDFIDIPYIAGYHTGCDGFWAPRILTQRFVKCELAPDYSVWVLDGELNA
jgi:hypothetical protein